MDLFDLVAKITLDSSEYIKGLGESEEKTKSFGDKLKTAFTTIAGAAVVGKAIGAVKDLTSQSLEAYKSYEQLIGGVETLFKDSADIVQEYAANAYQTAGLSANQYMETVTSFSASLLQSLGGDAQAAANYADMAIRDMSDNANKMGTSMEAIQNAYQGFAKQNYTMLDNLKLGYGGTKTEMERLITDAEKLNSSFRAARDENGKLTMSYADIVDAIHIVQDEMGITGTTAKEASTTIEGSVNSVKAAWQNLLTGLADGNADLGKLITNFSNSIQTAGQNIIPRVAQILSGVATMIATAAPQLVITLGTAIIENAPMLIDGAIGLIFGLADGIIDSLPKLIPSIVAVILTIVDKLTEPNTIMKLIAAAFEIINAVAQGLIDAIPEIIKAVPTIMLNLIEAILRFLPQILASGTQLVVELALGIVRGGANVIKGFVDLFNNVGNLINERIQNARQWGSDLIANFINGIVAQAQALWETIKSIGQGIRNLIGFSEPKEGPLSNFHTYAPDMMKLFAQGIKENEHLVTDQLSKSFNFESTITPNVQKSASNNWQNGADNGIINIVVQSVLDGRVIGETAYKYQRGMARAIG